MTVDFFIIYVFVASSHSSFFVSMHRATYTSSVDVNRLSAFSVTEFIF